MLQNHLSVSLILSEATLAGRVEIVQAFGCFAFGDSRVLRSCLFILCESPTIYKKVFMDLAMYRNPHSHWKDRMAILNTMHRIFIL